ncbi:pirin family protein [Streptomyces sp. NPDC041068]|uniref:pirin family protein n=1 Tax=Streptomyces sp. NPDC041068 TaxID=3155130 RepID=UPI0033D21377
MTSPGSGGPMPGVGDPITTRTVDRIERRLVAGPDTQVDNKALVIAPGDFRRTDPFLLMAEDWFSQSGFDWHPHRGLETVTVVLGGVLEHGDSLGNAGALEEGDTQWMTAGHGIIHRELAFRNEYVHTLQLWLNLPATKKLVDTHYQDLYAKTYATYAEPGVTVKVVSGETGGARGPAQNQHPVLGLLITLDPETDYTQLIAAHDRAFAYVVTGEVTVCGRRTAEGETAWSDPVAGANGGVSALRLTTGRSDVPSKVMLFAGEPIREPVVAGGPFVMNSEAEIYQAYRDYEHGKFGPVPRLGRLQAR